jgi:hypothetical protein
MVETGACQDSSNDFYCAVTRYGCDEGSHWIHATELPDKIRCNLCPPLEAAEIDSRIQILSDVTSYPTSPPVTPTTTPATTSNDVPTLVPVKAPTFMPTDATMSPPRDIPQDSSLASTDDRNLGVILGATFGTVVALFSILMGMRVVCQKKKRQKRQGAQEQVDLDLETPSHSDPSEPKGVFS